MSRACVRRYSTRSYEFTILAIVVGAKGDEIAKVAEALKQEPRANTQAAERILQEIRQQ